jgi:hypothetical protein
VICGFRVQGLEFRVQGLVGLRAWSFWAWGLGSRVWGLGYEVWSLE